MHNGKIAGALGLNLNLWVQTFVVGPYRILSAIDSFLDGGTKKTDPSPHSTGVLVMLSIGKGMCGELLPTDSNNSTLSG